MIPSADSANVLMIGWQADAYAALTNHRCRVTAVVKPRHLRRARSHAPDGRLVVVPDPGDTEQVLAGLTRSQLALRDVDIVCTLSEEPMVAVAMLGQYCRRPNMAVDTALALRDKFLQKRHVRDAGLAVTDTRIVDILSDLLDDPQLPVVAKPINGAGTRNTHLIRNDVELSALATADAKSPKGPWLVEAFVEGEELHVDGVVRAGVVQGFAVGRYLHNLINIKSGELAASTVLAADAHAELYDDAEILISRALRALGHTDGVFHAEVFMTDNGLVFSECAGRLGGSLVQSAVLTQTGIDLADEWARAVLGLELGVRRRPQASHCGWVQLKSPVGVVRYAPEPTELLARPGCIEAHVMVTPGTEAPDSSVGSDSRAGQALVVGASDEEVRTRLYNLATWFTDAVIVE